MAKQTGQHGYLFRFDKVNATALNMLLQLHPGMKSVRSAFGTDNEEPRVFRHYTISIFP